MHIQPGVIHDVLGGSDQSCLNPLAPPFYPQLGEMITFSPIYAKYNVNECSDFLSINDIYYCDSTYIYNASTAHIHSKLNSNATPFVFHHHNTAQISFTSNKTVSVLNPLAEMYFPLKKKNSVNCTIASIMATIFILSIFVIYDNCMVNESLDDSLKEFDTSEISPKEMIKEIKLKNANKIVIGHLNINSLRNKFECLKYLIGENIDIFLVSETKLDESFPDTQFLLMAFILLIEKIDQIKEIKEEV